MVLPELSDLHLQSRTADVQESHLSLNTLIAIQSLITALSGFLGKRKLLIHIRIHILEPARGAYLPGGIR